MVFRSPKYYAELRKYRKQQELKLQASKLTSSQADEASPQARKPKAQASSQSSEEPRSQNQGTSEPSPYPGHKQQE